MTTKTIANRPSGDQGQGQGQGQGRTKIYRWVARGKSKLTAIHIFTKEGSLVARIQLYEYKEMSDGKVWGKMVGSCNEYTVKVTPVGNPEPGSGYQSAELFTSGNARAGYLLLATGGNAKHSGNGLGQTPRFNADKKRMKSRGNKRQNGREYCTLIYRKGTSAQILADEQNEKISQLREELERLGDAIPTKKLTPLLHSFLFPAVCDEPPSDVLLEEEEYDVAMMNGAPELADGAFPEEYVYDYIDESEDP